MSLSLVSNKYYISIYFFIIFMQINLNGKKKLYQSEVAKWHDHFSPLYHLYQRLLKKRRVAHVYYTLSHFFYFFLILVREIASYSYTKKLKLAN